MDQLLQSFSDGLRQGCESDVLSRGLSTTIAIDRQREKNLAALKDQWNMFLSEGRQLAIE